MKKIIFVLMFVMGTWMSTEAINYMHVSISIQTFYDELAPYGDWLNTPEYGYVWRPYFDQPESFRPYSSNGNWVNTEYGWTWVSGYRWGWAPFHYGRWYFDDYLGWMWIPGTEWAPAWVTWGSYNDCWGWAPLGPGIHVNINFNWIAPDLWWTFVPCRHFYSDNWRNYIYTRHVHVTNIIRITDLYNDNTNRYHNPWFYGPRVNDVERYGRRRVSQLGIVENDRPGNPGIDNGRINIYSPRVEQRNENYRPAEFRNIESARSGNRIQQQNARANDPGMNRPRDERGEMRQKRQDPGQRTASVPWIQPKRSDPENGRSIENRDENRSRETHNINGTSDNRVRETGPGITGPGQRMERESIQNKRSNSSNISNVSGNKSKADRKDSRKNKEPKRKRHTSDKPSGKPDQNTRRR